MPILGPQREAPFCSEGGRFVLLIAREGNGVMGAIFPTGPMCRLWSSRRACRSECRRPDGPCFAIAECCFTGMEDEGRSRAAQGAHALPGGSRSRLRPSLWGSVSLALMPETGFGTCLPFPDLRASPCHGKLSFLLLLKFDGAKLKRGGKANALRVSVDLWV